MLLVARLIWLFELADYRIGSVDVPLGCSIVVVGRCGFKNGIGRNRG
jgi:hypothetical protein